MTEKGETMLDHPLMRRFLCAIAFVLCTLSAALLAENVYLPQLAAVEQNPNSLFSLAGQCSSNAARGEFYKTISTEQQPVATAYTALVDRHPELNARYLAPSEFGTLYRNTAQRVGSLDLHKALGRKGFGPSIPWAQNMLLFVVDSAQPLFLLPREPLLIKAGFNEFFIALLPRNSFTSLDTATLEQLIMIQFLQAVTFCYGFIAGYKDPDSILFFLMAITFILSSWYLAYSIVGQPRHARRARRGSLLSFFAWAFSMKILATKNIHRVKTFLHDVATSNPTVAPALCAITNQAEKNEYPIKIEALNRKITTTQRIATFFAVNGKPIPRALELRAAALQRQASQPSSTATNTPTLEAFVDFISTSILRPKQQNGKAI